MAETYINLKMYKLLIRPFLFLFDPEQVHHITFKLIKLSFKIPGISKLVKICCAISLQKNEREIFGLNFKNPVSLSFGIEKNGILID